MITLTWTAVAGDHEWRIEVWEGGKLEASRSGSIEVKFPAGSGVLEIKEVQVIPNPPTVKKPVTFRIKVKNLYSVSKEAKISLEIPEIGFKTDLIEVIAPGDYGIFDIQWNPGEVGLFNVITNLFSREDEEDKLEDEEHTTVRVRDNLFGRLVPNVNNTVTQGTTVHFDVIVENKDDYPAYNVPIRVFYTYQKPNGEFSDPTKVFERNPRQIDGLGVNITWFNMTLANLGEYYFTLYVNGELEDEKIITVNPNSSVMAWMECESPVHVDSSTTCVVHIRNYNPTPIKVSLEDIYFAGIPIWNGVNDDSVKIPINSKRTVTVPANSENDDMGFEIIFNDNLAEKLFTADYFLSPGGSYYKYLLTPGGQPAIYRAAVKLSTGQMITYDICLLPNTVDVTGYEIFGGSLSGAGVILAFLDIDVGTLLTAGGLLLYFYPSIKAPSPLGATETDNNLIGGG